VHLVRDPFPEPGDRASLRVICVGNAYRGDDAAALEVAKLLQGTLPEGAELLEREGEPTALMDAWEAAEAVWLVDAVHSGAPSGTVHRLDAGEQELPAGLFRASTHAFGLAEAVELARALGRLPARTIVFGIEGARFEAGDELSSEVAAAVPEVAEALRREVVACTSRR
jgi:hydrogenase maturation protease